MGKKINSLELKLLVALKDARSAYGLNEEGAFTLVVAVSGGSDSMALLHALKKVATGQKLSLVVAHVNHKFRAESDADADFVVAEAKKLGLPFYLFEAPAKPKTANLESWGREIRYSFLSKVLSEAGGHAIVTAHHFGDQTETILFKILSGRMGLFDFGMKVLDTKRNIFRPLLYVSKEEIVDYIAEHAIAFVHDSSNEDLGRTRNKIRLQLLPYLKSRFNPNLEKTLSRFSEQRSFDDDYLWEKARVTAQNSRSHIEDLLLLPMAMRWRVLVLKCEEEVGEVALTIGAGKFIELAKHLTNKGGLVFELHSGVSAKIENSSIYFEQKGEGL